jgi:adenine/guanine phosphoribosyltransferase-like PRPP-binding protein
MDAADLRSLIREIPDFPQPGIVFKDITPLLLDAAALDRVGRGTRVLIHDDLLATGGTARGVCDLVAGLGAEIAGCAFLIELSFLGGRERLKPYPVHAVLDYAA